MCLWPTEKNAWNCIFETCWNWAFSNAKAVSFHRWNLKVFDGFSSLLCPTSWIVRQIEQAAGLGQWVSLHLGAPANFHLHRSILFPSPANERWCIQKVYPICVHVHDQNMFLRASAINLDHFEHKSWPLKYMISGSYYRNLCEIMWSNIL